MSRAGKYPVKLNEGVSVAIVDNALVVKGPKGELKLPLDTKNAALVDIVIEEGQVVINPKDAEEKSSRTMWGTMARNIRNAVEGVSKGFEKPMYMKGVGYKAAVKGNQLVLVAGYSHDVVMDIPEGLTVEMGAAVTEFTVKGMDKCLVLHLERGTHQAY